MSLSTSGNRHQIVKDSTKFLSATFVAQILGLVRSIAMVVLFNPAQLGIFNLMTVIVGYGANAHVGLLHGLNKAMPFLRGQDQIEQVEEMKDGVFWLTLVLGFVVGGALVLASFLSPPEYGVGLRFIAAIVLLQLTFMYVFSVLRADNRFGLASQAVVILGALSAGLILFFAFIFPDRLTGALIGWLGAYLLVNMYIFTKAKYHFAFRLNRQLVQQALILGFPLIVIDLLMVVFLSVDRWIIVVTQGEAALGYYALGIMTSSMLGLVPGSVASVIYPQMLERMGVTGDRNALNSLVTIPLRSLTMLMIVLICCAAFGVPFLVQLFLPRYLPSVPIIQILVFGSFFYATWGIPSAYLTAINKQGWLILLLIMAMTFSVIVDTLLLRAGLGITGVALGTVGGYLIYGTGATLVSACLMFGQWTRAIYYVARLLAPFGLAVLAVLVASSVIGSGSTLAEQVISLVERLIIVMSMLLPVLWLLNRDGELVKIVRAEMKTWIAARI